MYSRPLMNVALALLAVISQADAARAEIFGFEAINGGPAKSQFTVEVTYLGTHTSGPSIGLDIVGFKFTNTGPVQSSITDIYFQDGLWYGSLLGIEQSAGVDFAPGATPAHLPWSE
jgi:hypothetical protein